MRSAAVRTLLFVSIAILAWPVRWYPVTAGLDPSWAFAVNDAHARGLIFGRDVFFTYGPLAWLTLPMDIGGNLVRGIAFQVFCWLVFTGVICWLVFGRRIGSKRLLCFAVCLLIGRRAFHFYDYVGPELFLAFLGLLLLGAAAVEKRWRWFHTAAWIIGVLLLFVKFTAGIMVLSAVILFAAGAGLRDRRMALHSLAAAAIGAPLLFAAGYLVYFPSAAGLVRYVRAGLEVSSGYSTAMTSTGPPGPLLLALVVVVSWLVLMIRLYVVRDRAFPIALAFLGPLFLVFKHSFVREPLHVGMIFAFTPLLLAIVVLFSEMSIRDGLRLAPAATILGAGCLTLAATGAPAQVPLASDQLPAEILSAIGARPVAIFPYECAYAAANGLNFRPFPIVQAYSAYTPYLDGLDAAFLEDDQSAPPLVLFEWKSIDGRNPLLDTPATTLSLYRHYDLAVSAAGRLLLRRRPTPRFGLPRLIETRVLRLGRPFSIPASRHPLIARVYLRLTPFGSLRKLLFRIPAVSLSGFRVPPEVIEDGVPLNFLPGNLKDVEALFAGGPIQSRSGEFVTGGPGARFLRDPVRVEILEIPELNL
jgi:hypothetical protein